jgi:hypothetical protein
MDRRRVAAGASADGSTETNNMNTELTQSKSRGMQARAAQSATARGVVVTYLSATSAKRGGHEAATQRQIARRLADLKSFVDGVNSTRSPGIRPLGYSFRTRH